MRKWSTSVGLTLLAGLVATLFTATVAAQGLTPKKPAAPPEQAEAEKAKPRPKPKAKPRPKAAAGTSSDELAQIKADQEALAAQVEELKAQLDNAADRGPALTPEQESRVAELEAKKAEDEKKLAGLQEAVANGLDPSTVEGVMKDLEAEIAGLEQEIAAVGPVSPEKKTAELEAKLAAAEERIKVLEGEHPEPAQGEAEPAAEPKPISGFMVRGPGDSFFKLSGLLQAWATTTESGAPDGESWDTEFYIRRMRLMVYGQVTDWLNFFIETDNANFGKGGDWSGSMFIQDAYMEFNFHEAIQIDVGMLLPPFIRHSFQAATSQLSLDYHSKLIRYMPGSHKVWRDAGIMLRGMPAGKWIEYRFGIFNGVRGDSPEGRNETDSPRITARLTFNVFDAEGGGGVGGMFYDGLYLKKTDDGVVSTKRVLSIGGAVDWQKGVNVRYDTPPDPIPEDYTYTADERTDYIGAGGDLFWDLPFGENRIMSLNGQVNFAYYDHGNRNNRYNYYNVTGDAGTYGGVGLMGEIGFRYSAFQPLFIFDYFKSEGGWDSVAGAKDDDLGSYTGIFGGFNWYILGHAAALKLQIGAAKVNGGDYTSSGTLQAQFIF